MAAVLEEGLMLGGREFSANRLPIGETKSREVYRCIQGLSLSLTEPCGQPVMEGPFVDIMIIHNLGMFLFVFGLGSHK